MHSLFRFVLIKLRYCGHLALSCSLKLRAKLVLYLVYLKACVLKLCVLLYTVQCCPEWQVVWCVIVIGCDCQLDFNKDYLLLLLLLVYKFLSIKY